MTVEKRRMLILRGSSADWQRNNIVLLPGELGVQDPNLPNPILRIGDGVRTFLSLPPIGIASKEAFATQIQVDEGTVDDKAVSPATLRGHLDNQRFSTGIVSAGAQDFDRSPRLNVLGKLDASFLTISVGSYRGLMDPTENNGGPQVPAPIIDGSPSYQNGDFLYSIAASSEGLGYDFAGGTAELPVDGSRILPVPISSMLIYDGAIWTVRRILEPDSGTFLPRDGSLSMLGNLVFERSGSVPEREIENVILDGGNY